jgi:hypothetical protein
VDLASIRRAKWANGSFSAARRATLQTRPRLFGQSQKVDSRKSIFSILHIPTPVWAEDGLLPGPPFAARHKISEQ